MIDKYTQCTLCKNKATDTHHLIMGSGRKFADRNELVIPICRTCHTKIHSDGAFEKLSCIAGQLMYEEKFLNSHPLFIEEAREKFIKENGRSYL